MAVYMCDVIFKYRRVWLKTLVATAEQPKDRATCLKKKANIFLKINLIFSQYKPCPLFAIFKNKLICKLFVTLLKLAMILEK